MRGGGQFVSTGNLFGWFLRFAFVAGASTGISGRLGRTGGSAGVAGTTSAAGGRDNCPRPKAGHQHRTQANESQQEGQQPADATQPLHGCHPRPASSKRAPVQPPAATTISPLLRLMMRKPTSVPGVGDPAEEHHHSQEQGCQERATGMRMMVTTIMSSANGGEDDR